MRSYDSNRKGDFWRAWSVWDYFGYCWGECQDIRLLLSLWLRSNVVCTSNTSDFMFKSRGGGTKASSWVKANFSPKINCEPLMERHSWCCLGNNKIDLGVIGDQHIMPKTDLKRRKWNIVKLTKLSPRETQTKKSWNLVFYLVQLYVHTSFQCDPISFNVVQKTVLDTQLLNDPYFWRQIGQWEFPLALSVMIGVRKWFWTTISIGILSIFKGVCQFSVESIIPYFSFLLQACLILSSTI